MVLAVTKLLDELLPTLWLEAVRENSYWLPQSKSPTGTDLHPAGRIRSRHSCCWNSAGRLGQNLRIKDRTGEIFYVVRLLFWPLPDMDHWSVTDEE